MFCYSGFTGSPPMARMELHTFLLRWGHTIGARGRVTAAGVGGDSLGEGPDAVEIKGI